MNTVPAYTSDLTAMSDSEMEVLAGELVEAYRISDYEYGYEWTDAEAEARYDAMQAEKHRRWMVAHPDWKPTPMAEFMEKYVTMAMRDLTASLDVRMAGFCAGIGQKIGDTVTIRKPYHFYEQEQSQ